MVPEQKRRGDESIGAGFGTGINPLGTISMPPPLLSSVQLRLQELTRNNGWDRSTTHWLAPFPNNCGLIETNISNEKCLSRTSSEPVHDEVEPINSSFSIGCYIPHHHHEKLGSFSWFIPHPLVKCISRSTNECMPLLLRIPAKPFQTSRE